MLFCILVGFYLRYLDPAHAVDAIYSLQEK